MRSPKALELHVRVSRLPLSRAAGRAFFRLESYDWIVFTSKHAARFFGQELRRRRIGLPSGPRIAAVGKVTAAAVRAIGLRVHLIPAHATVMAVIKALGTVRGRRVLFPRSAIAPATAVRALRARGGRVTVIPLYTTEAIPLTVPAKRKLLAGRYATLIFKSPSGVEGLMRQLSAAQRKTARRIPAQCIGPTTGDAARKAGFKKISIKA